MPIWGGYIGKIRHFGRDMVAILAAILVTKMAAIILRYTNLI